MSKTYRKYRNKKVRDGWTSEGSAKKDYRHLTNKLIRNKTKQFISKEKYDNVSFPSKDDGKKFIWSIW